MNRVEELTFRLTDGDLSETERAELDALLARDESARKRHLDLLALEVALRGGGRPADVAESTVARLKEDSSADLEMSVMRTIAALPAPAWSGPNISRKPVRRRIRVVLSACLATAAAVFLAFWLLKDPQAPHAPTGGPAPEGTAVLVQASQDVQVESDRGTETAGAGRQVQPGETVRTPEDGFAVLQFADGTLVELYEATRARLEQGREGAKRVRLEEGGIRADVKPQLPGRPLVVATPHTELRVLGTRFDVTSFDEAGTRVDLEKGEVEVAPSQAPAVLLEPGSAAFVAYGAPAVVFQSRPAGSVHPVREDEFRGLRSLAFLPDGQTVLGATGWQVVSWHPTELKAVPLYPERRRPRDGIAIQRQAGPMLAFTDRQQKRLGIWDARTRKTVFVREMLEGPDQIAAVSPQGDWLVTWDPADVMKTPRLWRTGQEQPLTLSGRWKAVALAPSPDGKLLAVGRKRHVELVDVVTGRPVVELPIKKNAPHALAFSPDGKFLAVGLSGRAEVWDVRRREVVATFEQPGLPLAHVALGRDGKRLAAASVDDRVWVWNADRPRDPTLLQARKRVQALDFSPNGETLAVLCREGLMAVWELSE